MSSGVVDLSIAEALNGLTDVLKEGLGVLSEGFNTMNLRAPVSHIDGEIAVTTTISTSNSEDELAAAPTFMDGVGGVVVMALIVYALLMALIMFMEREEFARIQTLESRNDVVPIMALDFERQEISGSKFIPPVKW
ncbi:unnamed protein product, partial [Meganyctiphanes norvegica]